MNLNLLTLYYSYNIEDSNINDINYEKLDKTNIVDVILVKKYYGDRSQQRKRLWKLKHLDEEDTALDKNTMYVLIKHYFEYFQ